MPDWNEIVRERLGPLGLAPEREGEIIAELALHLEEACAAHVREGLPDSEAAAMAVASVTDWKALGRKIRRAKVGRSGAPVFVFLAVPILLVAVSRWTFQNWAAPALTWRAGDFVVRIGIPALVALIVIGFLVAHLCARVGGSYRDQVFSAMFAPASLFLMGLCSSALSYVTFGLSNPVRLIVIRLSFVIPPLVLLLFGALTYMCLARREGARCEGYEGDGKSASGLAAKFRAGAPFSKAGRGSPRVRSVGIPWLSLMIGVPLYHAALIFVDPAISGPYVFQLKKGLFALAVSGPLIASTVLLGFLLANASRRVGGGTRMQLVVALVPAAWWMIVLAFMGLRYPLLFPAWMRISAVAGTALSTSIVPAVGLALGGLLAVVVGRSMTAARRCEFAAVGG